MTSNAPSPVTSSINENDSLPPKSATSIAPTCEIVLPSPFPSTNTKNNQNLDVSCHTTIILLVYYLRHHKFQSNRKRQTIDLSTANSQSKCLSYPNRKSFQSDTNETCDKHLAHAKL
jgi:hypothetical protein